MADTRNIENELERIRHRVDALLVLCITPGRGFVAVDPKLAPKDAIETLRNEIPALADYLQQKTQRASHGRAPEQPKTLRQQKGDAFYDTAWARYTTGEEITELERECLQQEGLL
jgi:hypothetical protein